MLQTFDTQIISTAFKYLQSLNVNITQTTLRKNLEENPFFPSLFSLNQVFDRLNVPNATYRIPAEQADQLEAPFVAYMKNQPTGKDFVLVTDYGKETVTYYQNNKKKHLLLSKFLEDWENIIFVAEKESDSGEREYAKNKQQEKRAASAQIALISGGIAIYALFSLLFFQSTGLTYTSVSIWIIKTLGVVAAIPLLMYEIDHRNALVKQICTAGRNTDCHAVLGSKAAKILGISWSEMGLFYFAATFLLLFLPATWATKAAMVAIISALAAPYIVFSIYYQWRIVKQWCLMCLMVQAVLLLEVLWSIPAYWWNAYSPILEAYHFIWVIIAVAFPIVAWYALKPLLAQFKKGKNYTDAYHRLLYNPDVFDGILDKQQVIPNNYNHIGIEVGNPNARHTIVKVCNPYCGPCASAHPNLESIIERNKDIKLKIIFTSSNKEADRGGIVVRHLMAIAAKGDAQLTQKALDDWYLPPVKDYEKFADKYPLNGEVEAQKDKIDAMSDWCEKTNIRFTPTIFIDGKQLPETYSIEELKHIF
jgi:uncharacterized membrane protein